LNISSQEEETPLSKLDLLQKKVIDADCYLYIAFIQFIKQDLTGLFLYLELMRIFIKLQLTHHHYCEAVFCFNLCGHCTCFVFIFPCNLCGIFLNTALVRMAN